MELIGFSNDTDWLRAKVKEYVEEHDDYGKVFRVGDGSCTWVNIAASQSWSDELSSHLEIIEERENAVHRWRSTVPAQP